MKKFIRTALCTFLFSACLTPFFSFYHLKISEDQPGRWEKLGQRKVNFRVDKDEIEVGRFEGFFDALQIKVKKGPINMHNMVEIELKNNFTAGSDSRIIDLPGNRRIIDKVVFWYDKKNFASSKAVVELWGRH